MKHVQACLSAREYRDSNFHERPDNAVLTSEDVL